jgi:FkbM family methyltransferase
MKLSTLIKKVLALTGVGVYRLSIQKRNREAWMIEKNYRTVIDIGANVGQFATEIRAILPNTKIISFEPLPDCFSKLKEIAANDKNMFCFNFAIGENNEVLSLNINQSSATSSLLRSSNYLKNNFPESDTVDTIQVPVKTLDSLNLELNEPTLLKIDVQGYEKSVLKGALKSLPFIDTVLVELSFFELYEGQPLFDEVYAILKENNFVYVGNYDQIHSPINGLVLQSDSIFFRKN